MAVLGTPDAGDTPRIEDCNTASALAEPTGERANCVSRWGHHDMVGNVWKWVADWVPASNACPGWGAFSDEFMCLSGASTVVEGPGALIRGGVWSSGSGAGPFAIVGQNPPLAFASNMGFRGAR